MLINDYGTEESRLHSTRRLSISLPHDGQVMDPKVQARKWPAVVRIESEQ